MNFRRIHEILIMTLEATPHRKWGSIGALDARGFPMDRVEPVHGIDGLQYETHEKLIKAAVADGFTFFAENRDFLSIPIPMAAGTWSACRALRHIVEEEKTTLLMEDDWIFNIDYDDIEQRLRAAEHKDTQIAVLFAKMFHGKNYRYDIKPINEYWVEGVPASAAAATLYTPDGAKLVLNHFGAQKAVTLEKAVMGIEYPTAITMLPSIARHPMLMGASRANPSNNREKYMDAYERWHRGTTI